MATTIKLKNGSGAPLASDLVQGEPALDLTNKRLYTEDSGGSVIEVGTNPSTLTVDGDLTVDTNTLHVDSTNNEVGINTPTPSRALDVRSGQQAISHFGSTSGVRGIITLSDVNSTVESNQGIGAYGNDISIFTASAQRLTVDSSGNVGIGTDSPSSPLEVIGDNPVRLTRAGLGGPNLEFANDDGIIGEVQTLTSKSMVFTADPSNDQANSYIGWELDGTERMRINTSGNVGIDVISPAEKLEVNGPVLVSSAEYTTNVDEPYLIAGTNQYDGTTSSNWGSFGIQHRLKSTASGTSRVTIDTAASGEAFSVDNQANVCIAAGNGDGKGITFNSTLPNASTTLDYYEEGDWTPVLSDANTGGNTATISGTQKGKYTRIGNVVTCSFELTGISTTGMTGGSALFIQNLPFVGKSDMVNRAPIGYWANITLVTNGVGLSATIPNSATYVAVNQNKSVGGVSPLTVSQLTSGTASLIAVFTYLTNS